MCVHCDWQTQTRALYFQRLQNQQDYKHNLQRDLESATRLILIYNESASLGTLLLLLSKNTLHYECECTSLKDRLFLTILYRFEFNITTNVSTNFTVYYYNDESLGSTH